MMQYNKNWIENLMTQQTALQWLRNGHLDKQEFANVVSKTKTEYKHTALLPRIGYGFFTLVISLGGLGFFALMASSIFNSAGWLYFLIISAILFFIQNRFVNNRNYFANGIDDMLQHLCLYALLFSLGWMVFYESQFESTFIILFTALGCIIYFFAATYFVDSWFALLSFVFLIIFEFLVLQKIGGIIFDLMPFIIMLAAWPVLLFAINAQQKIAYLPYYSCFNILQIASLLLLYAAGNYFVVNEARQILFGSDRTIPMFLLLKIFFYAYTIIFPLAIIYYGLKNKSALAIRLGLLFSIAAVLTVKYYNHIMPLEFALIVSGVLIILLAWYCIKKLKSDFHHITSEDNGESGMLMPAAEALAILNALRMPATKQEEFKFGDGSTGGGGATGEF